MKRNLLMWASLLAVLMMFVVSCGDDDDDDNDDDNDTESPDDDATDDDTGDDDVTPDAMSSASPENDDTVLKDTHSGWKRVDCLTCHESPHLGGFAVGECATCHGGNGASLREAGHANNDCTSCHAESHAGLGLQSPTHCAACHKYTADVACPITESYDAVVIGAGGGGLAAATALARAGMNVALVEKNYKVGGYMTTFHRGDYTFEASLHAMGGMEGDGGAAQDFERLGIADRIEPVYTNPMYTTVFPGLTLKVPANIDDYRAQLKETFPTEAAGIDQLFTELRDVNEALMLVEALEANPSIETILALLEDLSNAIKLIKYMTVTLEDMVRQFTDNQELIGVWTQLVTFLGDGSDSLQALYFMSMWSSYHEDGYYYLHGGSRAISEAMADVIRENGGTVKLNTLATKIVIVDGRATQVQTAGDGCFDADYVISNANAPETLLDMVGAENLPADYVADLNEMSIGAATVQIFLGVDKDYRETFGTSHEIMVNTTYDPNEAFDWISAGDVDRVPLIIADYSVPDPSMAPEGKNSIAMATYLPYDWQDTWRFSLGYDSYNDLKDEVAWALIERAEEFLPDLTKHIEVLEVGTPVTNYGFSRNPQGTIFGWANTPEQGTLRRLPQQTPIDNLLLAGAWTFPGGGQSAVISSGIGAADMVLEKAGQARR